MDKGFCRCWWGYLRNLASGNPALTATVTCLTFFHQSTLQPNSQEGEIWRFLYNDGCGGVCFAGWFKSRVDSVLLAMVSSSGCRCEPLLSDAWQQLMLDTCGLSSSNCCQYRDGAGKDWRKKQGEGSVQWVMGLWERSFEFGWRVSRERRAYGLMQPPVLAAELMHTRTPCSAWDPPAHNMDVQPCSPLVPAFLLPRSTACCPWTLKGGLPPTLKVPWRFF